MGQSNSRNQQPDQTARRRSLPAPSQPRTTIRPSLSPAIGSSTAPQPKPRSSFRNSVATLIRPGSQKETVDVQAQGPETVKKSWRGSRIFAKASRKPSVSSPSVPHHLAPTSSAEHVTQPELEASSSTQVDVESSLPASALPILETAKAEERASLHTDQLQDSHEIALQASPIPLSVLQSQSETSERDTDHSEETTSPTSHVPLAHRLGLSGTSEFAVEHEHDAPSPNRTASIVEDSVPVQESPAEFTQPNVQPTIPSPPVAVPPRSFPPPGTLVLVQGVVQTTDVPRATTNPESVTAEPSSTNTRSRPSSMSVSPSGPSWTSHSTAPRPSSMSAVPHASSRPTGLNAEEGRADPPSSSVPQSADAETPSTTISSSSIDVLGTLLSVAAAATAASLLTGSATGTTLNASSPSSPLATSSPPLSEFGQTARRERMRQAWGSLRERLGLRAQTNNTLSSTPASTTPPRSSTDPNTASSVDAREMMLTEMARAFNMGLGLDSNNSEQSSQRSSAPPADANGSDTANSSSSTNSPIDRAAEGTFDRFLEDLQTDLRLVLTGNGNTGDTNEQDGHSESEDTLEGEDAVDDDDDQNGSSSLPSSAYVSNSSDEEELTDEEDAATSPSRATPGPAMNVTGEQASNTGPPRHVNWWRTYRFSPISTRSIAGTVDSHGASTDPSQARVESLASVPTPNTPSAQPNTSVPGSLSASPTDATSSSHSPSAPAIPGPPTDVVYPVIVVGLRSVDTPRATQRQSAAVPPSSSSAPRETAVGDEAADPLLDHDEPPAPRESGWRQRAASAVRNLRSTGGRFSESAEAESESANAPDESGSRTFLIFVIGGYYPPGHSMVVGGPDTLDSFEALLELTELLGQVKSSTASREDIEKSGLKIIKASALKVLEEEGKVTSNCVDRCLICLDEYDEDDDVRLMSCRHGFHQACVDRWLETGKNSCPACRSKGVPTAGADPSPSTDPPTA